MMTQLTGSRKLSACSQSSSSLTPYAFPQPREEMGPAIRTQSVQLKGAAQAARAQAASVPAVSSRRAVEAAASQRTAPTSLAPPSPRAAPAPSLFASAAQISVS